MDLGSPTVIMQLQDKIRLLEERIKHIEQYLAQPKDIVNESSDSKGEA